MPPFSIVVDKFYTLFGPTIFWILNAIFCILISKSPSLNRIKTVPRTQDYARPVVEKVYISVGVAKNRGDAVIYIVYSEYPGGSGTN